MEKLLTENIKLYGTNDGIYFDNKAELLKNIFNYELGNVLNIVIIDYLPFYAGQVDVIKKTYADGSVKYLSVVSSTEVQVLDDKQNWQIIPGDLRKEYTALRMYNVNLTNDPYVEEEQKERNASRKLYKEIFKA